MNESERVELEELMLKLREFKGRHTELISVYMPAGANFNIIANQIEQEKSTASNIKSKSTRNNVLDALEKITRHFKLYRKTPANGLAVFCGNISRIEGQPQIELWAIEPPQPLNVKLYRCDQEFLLEPLEEMLKAKDVYGLIAVDRDEATFGLLEGKNIKFLRHLTSGAPGKHKKGGQSAGRYERAIEEVIKEYYRRVADIAKELFFGLPRLKGLLIGGPGLTKDIFLEKSQLITGLKEKIIAVKALGYAGESALKMLVNECTDVLEQEEIMKEKELVKEFLTALASQPGRVAYGLDKVKKALSLGAVEKLLISRAIDKAVAIELKKQAASIDAPSEIISLDTEEGVQFKNIGGIGAFLRFAVE